MLGPSSPALILLLIVVAAGSLLAAGRGTRLALRVPAALLALLLPFLAGIAAVNAAFAYYRTWSDLAAGVLGNDLSGVQGVQVHRAPPPAPAAVAELASRPGRLLRIALPGPVSGVNGRTGLVYVPPEVADRRFDTSQLPIVELFHGTPGQPADYLNGLHVDTVMDQLRAARQVGPMILVMPDSNGGRSRGQECTNAVAGVQDDTYLSIDVPRDVRSQLGLSTPARSSGLMGYSSGGYCAVNLALRHRLSFHAAAALDGYFSPLQAPYAAALFRGNRTAERANDPLVLARTGPRESLPAMFLASGSGDPADLAAARQFLGVLGAAASAQLVIEPGARHTFTAWRTSLPAALAWMWPQLRTPGLARDYPEPAAVALPRGPSGHRPAAQPEPYRPGSSASQQQPATATPSAAPTHRPTGVPTAPAPTTPPADQPSRRAARTR